MTPIRIILADDHAMVRAGLRMVLEHEGDIVVVGEAADGQEAIDLVREVHPDIVVMDFAMPVLSGVASCQIIRRDAPQTQVLFLSMYEDRSYFQQALAAGAVGYLVKRSAAPDLCAAIRGAMHGVIYLAPPLASVVLTAPLLPNTPLERLTPREREILERVARGQTSQMIARDLVISVKTVQTHREHIMEKLDLQDITHLVRFAIRHGIITPSE